MSESFAAKQIEVPVRQTGATNKFLPALALEPVRKTQRQRAVERQQSAGDVESMFILARQYQESQNIGVLG